MSNNDDLWREAIRKWHEGDMEAIATLILDPSIPVPGFARDFFAKLAEGNQD